MQPPNDLKNEPREVPFDDYRGGRGERSLHLAPLARVLRILSGLALAVAIGGAVVIFVMDAVNLLRPDMTWRLKSAIPLIALGTSYALLQFTLPRTLTELCLGLAVSAGFTLWGIEQFVPSQHVATLIDDVVVFVFVLDLSIVIRGKLRKP